MSIPAYVKKTLRLKPEVTKVFDDLEKWLDYCRINLIDFNPADMYRSAEYKVFQRTQEYLERKARREAAGIPEPVKVREPYKYRGDRK